MDEVWQPAASIHLLTGGAYTPGERVRPTAEHANFRHIAVLLLHKLQERSHVWSAKMIYCLESSEHASFAEALEVVLTDVQHSCSQIKLMEELCNENVHFENISDVLALHIPQHIDEPFKLAVGRADPQEVHLFTSNP